MSIIAYTLAVFWKEVQVIFKDRGGLAIFFLLPLVLGLMTGAPNAILSPSGESKILLNVVLANEDSGAFGQEIVKALGEINELKVEVVESSAAAEERVAKGKAAAAIVIPAGLSQKVDAHTPTTIEVIVDPAQAQAASIVTGIVNQVAAEVNIWGEVQYGVRSLLAKESAAAAATTEQRRAAEAQTMGVIMTTLNEMRRTPAIAVIRESMTGVKVEGGIVVYIALLFAGFTVMFIFLTVSWSAQSLAMEREVGTLRRLLAAPLPRSAVMGGKILAFMALACLQVVVLMGAARLAFSVPLGQSPVAMAALTLAAAFAAAAMGMAVAALTRSSKQASNMGLLLGFLLAGLGGCMPAMSKLPLVRSEGLLGAVAKLTPHGHALDAYYTLMAEKGTFLQVWPQIVIVLVFGIVCFLVARSRFKFV